MTKINPTLQTKLFSEVEPGELIRFRWGRINPLAILTASVDENSRVIRRVLICFEWDADDAAVKTPFYMTEDDNTDDAVLSYGRDFEFSLDTAGMYVDVGAQRGSDTNGAIAIYNDVALLSVKAHPRAGGHLHPHQSIRYDISSGLLVAPPRRPSVSLILKWSIKLSKFDAPHLLASPMVKFEIAN